MSNKWSLNEYKKYTQKNGSKYHNTKTLYNGVLYDSKKEATRSAELQMLQRAGEILDLQLQIRIPLMVNGIKIGAYVADFVYYDVKKGKSVIEDSKGVQTAVFKLKKKILEANGYEILIT